MGEAVITQEKRCYTVKELQEILGISRPTVYELLKKNEFRWIQIGTKYRISKKSLMNGWIRNVKICNLPSKGYEDRHVIFKHGRGYGRDGFSRWKQSRAGSTADNVGA